MDRDGMRHDDGVVVVRMTWGERVAFGMAIVTVAIAVGHGCGQVWAAATVTAVGRPYVDAGAVAVDDYDGDVTASVRSEVHVDTSRPGAGCVSYSASDRSGNVGTACREVRVVGIALSEALDTGLAVTSTGTCPWFGQGTVTRDGVDAARSGPLVEASESVMVVTVTGPGTVGFWWRVSSGSGDWLRFSIDGVLRDRIAGEVAWTARRYRVGPGTHTLKWKYSRGGGGAPAGQDAAWVDGVTWMQG